MATAVDTSLPALLASLTSSLESASTALPESAAALPPQDGISLLDVKNELLLSYLQNLVFLILLKIRNASSAATGSAETGESLDDEVVKKLVQLRLYLEKGVRPLEGRLKYQIDKVVRAAEDADRSASHKPSNGVAKPSARELKPDAHGESDEESDEEASDAQSTNAPAAEIDELSYRPNPAAFQRPKPAAAVQRTAATPANDGVYRPPRITATAMPTTRGREERGPRKPAKSATMDEFIATELSTAPVAEPSIGSTITSGGRRTKSQRERDEDAERRAYEETNLVRLPRESKKERAKKGNRGREGGYGGEEWRGLGAGLDRIDKLTQRKGGTGGALERSRKRPVEDGPRGSGAQIGERFEKRRKMVARNTRR